MMFSWTGEQNIVSVFGLFELVLISSLSSIMCTASDMTGILYSYSQSCCKMGSFLTTDRNMDIYVDKEGYSLLPLPFHTVVLFESFKDNGFERNALTFALALFFSFLINFNFIVPERSPSLRPQKEYYIALICDFAPKNFKF